MLDETGQRLAKRHAALSLRTLRQTDHMPVEHHQLWTGC